MSRVAIRGLAGIVALMLVAGTVGQAGQTRSVIADVRAAIAQQDRLFAVWSRAARPPEIEVDHG